MDEAFKTTASLNEKLSGVALTAAEKSAEISSNWTKDTLAKLADLSKAKAEPANYAKAMTDFASASAEAAAEHMAPFFEIAKKSPDGHCRTDDGCWQRHILTKTVGYTPPHDRTAV